MAIKLLKITLSIPIIIILITIMIINVKIHYEPEIEMAGQDTINTDVLKELHGLKYAINKNADVEMQQIYPEGYLFINALYGLAWCNFLEKHKASEHFPEGLAEIQNAWNKINSGFGREPFDEGLSLPYGAFYTAWSTYLLGRKLIVEPLEKRDENDVRYFRERCGQIAAALKDNVYPASYYSGVWPADVVICAASLALHDKLFTPEYGGVIKEWIYNIKSKLDNRGLIPHSINSVTGQPLQSARGSSLGLMLIFLIDIDKEFADQQFRIYKSSFHDSVMGLSGIREYPKDEDGKGDVDSGPVIFQMGSAATIVGMQTFWLYGEYENSIRIQNALEAFAFPIENDGRKVYLFGLMPMADAFIALGHSALDIETGNKPDFYVFHLYSALMIIILLILLRKVNGDAFK